MKKSESGFVGSEFLFVLVVMVIIGLAGFLVWYRHNQAKPVIPTPKPANNTVNSCATEPELSFECAQLNNPPAGWATYTSVKSTIRFLYPTNWQLKQVSLSDAPSYYLENLTLTSPNNFEMYFTLEKTHVRPPQFWACVTPLKQTTVALNNQYNMVLDGTIGTSLLSTNPNNLLPDDHACGSLINALSSDKLFKFTGGYASGVADPTTDVFLNRAEVQVAKTIYASLKQ